MEVDRLSALDTAFLDLDHPDAPLHVGATLRLDGPAPSLAALRRHLDGRLDRAPRLRRRVLRGPLEAVWADDPGFDIARHVHAVTLGEGEPLDQLAGLLLSAPLPAGRPPWQMTLVRGLPDSGWALIAQVHHVLLDGVAAIWLAGLLLDLEPTAPRVGKQDWRPGREPRTPAGVARTAVAGARGAQAAGGALLAARTDPRALAAAAGGLAAPAAQTALDRTAGSTRAVASITVGLDDVREAGRRHGATVNDVFLAAVTPTLGAALARRGARPQSVRALVPVNVRGPSSASSALGNQISFIPCDLPVGIDDPLRALGGIARQTAERKRSGAAAPLAMLVQAAEVLPPQARRVLTRTLAGRMTFTTIVSNVPGPTLPLYLMGSRLRAVAPAVPLLHGHALTFGAVSYDGALGVGLYADAAVVDDLPEIAADLERAFRALVIERGAVVTPWRARARQRRAS